MIPVIEKAWTEAFAVREHVELDEWARQNIRVGAWSPWEGNFTTDRTPWIVAPMRRLSQKGPKRVTMLGPAAGGKSTVGECLLAYIVDVMPGFTVWYAQDEEAAKEFAETRIQRFLESCDAVAKWFPANRHARRVQAIHFPHMSFLAQAANIGNAQSKHIRHVIKDETHLWKPGMSAAIDKRVARFEHNRTILELSTGSMKGDETDQSFSSGTREEWQFLCPKCRKHHVPQWSVPHGMLGGVKWSPDAKRADGSWSEARVAETLRYQCPQCGHEFEPTPANAYALNEGGIYIANNPEPAPFHYSFHWNCIASDFSQLAGVALEFLKAKAAIKRGTTALLKEFTQKKLAEAWSDEIQTIDLNVQPGEYDMGDQWPDEFRRFLTVDVQRDHFWFVCRAWSKDGRSRLVDCGRLSTWGELVDKARVLNVPARQVWVDSGYNASDVYRQCAANGWVAIKGEKAERGYPYTDENGVKRARAWATGPRQDGWLGTAQQGQQTCAFVLISDTITSDMLDLFRRGIADGWTRPRNVPEEWNRQIASMVRVTRQHPTTGMPVAEWKVVGKYGNHLWDCERVQLTCALASGFLSPVQQISTEEKK